MIDNLKKLRNTSTTIDYFNQFYKLCISRNRVGNYIEDFNDIQLLDLSEDNIDELIYLFLNANDIGKSINPSSCRNLINLCSKTYFLLVKSKSNLFFKNSVQALNFLVQQNLVFSEIDSIEAFEFEKLKDNYFHPWDIDFVDDKLLVVESRDTVRIENVRIDLLSNKGYFFTQVDRFDSVFVFNSCYSHISCNLNISSGAKTFNNSRFVLSGFFNGILIGITHQGEVFLGQELITSFKTVSPWRFRIIENHLFVFDWYSYRSFVKVDIVQKSHERIRRDFLFLPHDICKVDGSYLLLDKQQGFVFILSDGFHLIKKYFKFDFAERGLCDPIGIKKRSANEKVYVSNWLSGNVYEFKYKL